MNFSFFVVVALTECIMGVEVFEGSLNIPKNTNEKKNFLNVWNLIDLEAARRHQ